MTGTRLLMRDFKDNQFTLVKKPEAWTLDQAGAISQALDKPVIIYDQDECYLLVFGYEDQDRIAEILDTSDFNLEQVSGRSLTAPIRAALRGDIGDFIS